MRHMRQKVGRGRGNQGDFAKTQVKLAEESEAIRMHNAQVARRKADKKNRKKRDKC